MTPSDGANIRPLAVAAEERLKRLWFQHPKIQIPGSTAAGRLTVKGRVDIVRTRLIGLHGQSFVRERPHKTQCNAGFFLCRWLERQ